MTTRIAGRIVAPRLRAAPLHMLASASCLRPRLVARGLERPPNCGREWVGGSVRCLASASAASTSATPTAKSMGPDACKFAMLPPTSFSIIAHIDHGKSTLADRLLELTGTIPMEGESGVNRQVLDSLKVERERGITVKSQAVSMIYADQRSQGREYLLNLIDTPGHVDFAYEVSRSLSACQMALLVVDATQGIQSQTLSVFRIAVARGLRIIPIINKIDLPNANTDAVLAQLESRLGLDCMPGGQDEAILVSAKTGMGVEAVLQRIVDVGFDTSDAASSAPSAAALAPRTKTTAKRGEGEKLRALVFDSWYDSYRGVIALVSVHDGVLKTGDKLAFSHSKKKYEVLDAGINSPTGISTGLLCQGQVGWVVCNMKSLTEASIGDTLHHANTHVEPLAGFKPSVPMVYCAAFPVESSDFPKLEAAIQRLALNDRSVTYARESSNALGQGIKLGLLGALHLEIFRARLEDEYEQTILVTAPSVAYRLVHQDGSSRIISNPLDFPDHVASRVGTKGGGKNVVEVQEPMVLGTLTCPEEHVGAMMQLCADRRGTEVDVSFDEEGGAATTSMVGGDLDGQQQQQQRIVTMKYRLPLGEIVTDFFGLVKSKTAGFATFEYEDLVEGQSRAEGNDAEEDGWERSDVVKLTFLISGTPIDALCQVVHRSKAVYVARQWAQKIKDVVPRQQYDVVVQACVGGKVVAAEKKGAYRKDVLQGIYGGHYDRKAKLLGKQKEGKKRLRSMSFGRVQIPQESFMEILDSKSSGSSKTNK